MNVKYLKNTSNCVKTRKMQQVLIVYGFQIPFLVAIAYFEKMKFMKFCQAFKMFVKSIRESITRMSVQSLWLSVFESK